MLKDVLTEWNEAMENAIILEDLMDDDGTTIKYRKKSITFKEKNIIITSSLRPARQDNNNNTAYFVSVFIPDTGKTLENIPTNELCPSASSMIAIITALEQNNHEEVVNDRLNTYIEEQKTKTVNEWKNKLANTDYTEDAKNMIIEYAKSVLDSNYVRYRSNIFIEIMIKFNKEIIADPVVNHLDSDKRKYSLMHSIYGLICSCLENARKNEYGDSMLPFGVIQNNFWNTDIDLKIKSPITKTARLLLRRIYAECLEKSATFTWIIEGIAQFYALTTGETIEAKIAENRERAKRYLRMKELRNSSEKAARSIINPTKTDGFPIGDLFNDIVIDEKK